MSGLAAEKSKETSKVSPPKDYHVVLLNDDYTDVEFVIAVLEQMFDHTTATATQITSDVHKKGEGIAGTYTKDIAETKSAMVCKAAQSREFPLKTTVRES